MNTETVEVWRCAAGHEYQPALPALAVTCPICAKPYLHSQDRREGATKWQMQKS
jgi:hypothetical protein